MTIRQATNLDRELCTCGHLRGEHGNTAAGFGAGHGRCLAPLRSATRCRCEKFTADLNERTNEGRDFRMARARAKVIAPVVNRITASEVESLYALRERKEALVRELAEIDSNHKYQEAELIAKVESGWSREATARPFTVSVDSRRVVRWREEFEREVGVKKTLAVVDRTPPTIYKRVVFNEVVSTPEREG